MKTIIAIVVGIAVTSFVSPAQAQAARDFTLLSGGTNNLAALATNAAVIQNVSEWNALSLQVTAKGQSGNASNAQFYVYRSIDAENYETDPTTVLQLRLNGTTTQSALTNVDSTGAASIKIVPANTNAVAVSNIVLKVRFKISK